MVQAALPKTVVPWKCKTVNCMSGMGYPRHFQSKFSVASGPVKPQVHSAFCTRAFTVRLRHLRPRLHILDCYEEPPPRGEVIPESAVLLSVAANAVGASRRWVHTMGTWLDCYTFLICTAYPITLLNHTK